jgi:hypothetical protein
MSYDLIDLCHPCYKYNPIGGDDDDIGPNNFLVSLSFRALGIYGTMTVRC